MNRSWGSTATPPPPQDPQPDPQAATRPNPQPRSLHQRSSPKSGLGISHPWTSSKSHQCLPVAAVLTAAVWRDGSSHTGLPSGCGGERGEGFGGNSLV